MGVGTARLSSNGRWSSWSCAGRHPALGRHRRCQWRGGDPTLPLYGIFQPVVWQRTGAARPDVSAWSTVPIAALARRPRRRARCTTPTSSCGRARASIPKGQSTSRLTMTARFSRSTSRLAPRPARSACTGMTVPARSTTSSTTAPVVLGRTEAWLSKPDSLRVPGVRGKPGPAVCTHRGRHGWRRILQWADELAEGLLHLNEDTAPQVYADAQVERLRGETPTIAAYNNDWMDCVCMQPPATGAGLDTAVISKQCGGYDTVLYDLERVGEQWLAGRASTRQRSTRPHQLERAH